MPRKTLPTRADKPLRPVEALFLHHWLGQCDCDPSCFQNGRRAGIAAGWSRKSAHVTASRALNRANVRVAIQRAMVRSGLAPERIKEEVVRLSQVDPLGLFEEDEDGDLVYRPLNRMSAEVRACISRLEVDDAGRVTKIWLHNKTEALRLAAGIADLLKERHVHEGLITLSQIREWQKAADAPDED